jgi:hypothetical protein
VFFIPGESGVQAFEDAGMVFILGGESSYGGAGGGRLPLIAHEVAHIWWGHGVDAPRWFTEGMANYAAAKFVEHYYGPEGPAAGQGDPLSYRRYIVNFALASHLPIPIARRDELDDHAAIYHESAGILLTIDNRIDGGLDPKLAQLYEQNVGRPGGDTTQLGDYLSELHSDVRHEWDSMVNRAWIGDGPDDPTFRELVYTPSRDNYAQLLTWLNPTYRKSGMGDYAAASRRTS